MLSLYLCFFVWSVKSNFLLLMMLTVFFLFFYQFLGVSNFSLFFLDEISYLMVLLTVWIGLLMLCLSLKYLRYIKSYLMGISFLTLFLFLAFLSYTTIWFYVFFEISLFPLVYMIFVWGYQVERVQATFYLFFYTMVGSLPLLLLLVFFFQDISMSFWLFFSQVLLFKSVYSFLFFFLMMIFFIKLPLFFFHLWLPKAHVEAPVMGSMILAAVLLKLGGYGVYRFIYLFRMYKISWDLFLSYALWGALFSALICLLQSDLKSLVAYSSVSHMGVMISGVFLNFMSGLKGFLMIMLAHAFVSSALFFLVNYIYERSGSRQILISRFFSVSVFFFSVYTFLFLAGNFAAPPFLSLLGELGIFLSLSMKTMMLWFLLGGVSFFVAYYCIFFYSSVSHGVSLKYVNLFSLLDYYLLILLYHLIPLFFLCLKAEMFF